MTMSEKKERKNVVQTLKFKVRELDVYSKERGRRVEEETTQMEVLRTKT